eukprot:COSAG02_NODE_3120_length_7329_cov_2.938866_1_plen_86_part_00
MEEECIEKDPCSDSHCLVIRHSGARQKTHRFYYFRRPVRPLAHNRIFGPCLLILSILNRLERWHRRPSLCTTHDLTKAPQPKASL